MFPLRGPGKLAHETANFLGIYSTSSLERLKKKTNVKETVMDGHLAQVRHVFDKTHGRIPMVERKQYLNHCIYSKPASQSATLLLAPETRNPNTSQHKISTYVPLNTTSAHTSISTQHQHIRPFQHPPQSTSMPKRHLAFCPEPRNPNTSQHNISIYVHIQDRSSQGPRRPEYLSFPGPRSGNVTLNKPDASL